MSSTMYETAMTTNGNSSSGNNVPFGIIQPVTVTWTRTNQYKIYGLRIMRQNSGTGETTVASYGLVTGTASSHTFPYISSMSLEAYKGYTYYWQVRVGESMSSFGDWSVPVYFTVPTAPPKPDLLNYNGLTSATPEIGYTQGLTFSWNYNEYDGYEQAAFRLLVAGQWTPWILSSNTSYTHSGVGISTNTVHSWQVMVRDTIGLESLISKQGYFKVITSVISNPTSYNGTSLIPDPCDTLTPTLTWDCIDPSDTGKTQGFFKVEMFSGSYGSIIYTQTSGWINSSINSYMIDETFPIKLLGGVKYTWRITLKTPGGSQGPTSPWVSFKTSDALVNHPPSATLVNYNGSSPSSPVLAQDTTPILTWDYTDPDNDPQGSYSVRVYNASGVLISSQGWTGSSNDYFKVPDSLLNTGTIYHWNVQVKDSRGLTSQVSPMGYFKTPGVPVTFVVTPNNLNGSVGSPAACNTLLAPIFKWTFTGATSQTAFRVIIYNDQGAVVRDTKLISSSAATYTATNLKLDPLTVYSWTVQLKDPKSNMSLTSFPVYFKTIDRPHTKPTVSPTSFLGTLASPKDCTTLNPTFTWTYKDTDNDPQSGFKVLIYKVGNTTPVSASTDAIDYEPSTLKYYTPKASSLEYNTLYYWTVQVKDNQDDESLVSSQNYFKTLPSIVNHVPVIILSNYNGDESEVSSCDNTIPSLAWEYEDPDNDVQYNYKVDIFSSSNTLVHTSGTVTSSALRYVVPFGKLAPSTTYHWTVTVSDKRGAKGSPVRSGYFKTGTPPPNAAPVVVPTSYKGTKLEPATSTTLKPVLTWEYTDADNDVQGAYHVQVFTASGTRIKDSGWITSSAKTYTVPNGIVAGTVYYWILQVKDKNSSGEVSIMTDPCYFKYSNEAANTPPVVTPTSYTGTSAAPSVSSTLLPTLTWSYSDKEKNPQKTYTVVIRNSDGVEVINTGAITSQNRYYSVPSASRLLEGTNYNWKVSVTDSTGAAADGRVCYFKTTGTSTVASPDKPGLTSCYGTLSNPTETTTKPTLTWTYHHSKNVPQGSYKLTVCAATTNATVIDIPWTSGAATSYDVTSTVLSEDVMYYWKIQVKDTSGRMSPISSNGYFKPTSTEINNPPTVVLSSFCGETKEDPDACTTLTPVLSWAYTDADNDIQKSFNVGIIDVETDAVVYDTGIANSLSKNTVVPANKLTSGRVYSWYVTVFDSKGNSGVSSKGYFKPIFNRVPVVVTANYNGPINAPVISPSYTPLFIWKYSDLDRDIQVSYVVDVYSTAGVLVSTSGAIEDERYYHLLTTPLAGNTSYYWKVTVTDSQGGESVTTAPSYFKTTGTNNSFPVAIPNNYNGDVTSPKECLTLTPALTWDYIDAGKNPQTSYLAQIYDSTGTIVYSSNWKTSSEQFCITNVPLTVGTLYYWDISVKNSNNIQSPVGIKAYFKPVASTNKAPDKPILTSYNGTVSTAVICNTLIPKLNWSYYDQNNDPEGDSLVTVYDSITGDLVYSSNWVSGGIKEITVPSGKIPNANNTYKWCVIVKDNKGLISPMSNYGYFFTRAATNTLPIVTPASYAGTFASPYSASTLTPSLTWTYYQAQNSDQAMFNIIVSDNSNTIVWDSNWVVGSDVMIQVPESKLLVSVVYHWVIQVKDTNGNLSKVSDPVYFKTVLGTSPVASPTNFNGIITNPAACDTTSPNLTWSYYQAQSNLQASYCVSVYNSSLGVEYTSGWTDGTATTVVAGPLDSNETYHWTIQVKDTTGNMSVIDKHGYFKTPENTNNPIVTLESDNGSLATPFIDQKSIPNFMFRYVHPLAKDAKKSVITIYDASNTVVFTRTDTDTIYSPCGISSGIAFTLTKDVVYHWTVEVTDVDDNVGTSKAGYFKLAQGNPIRVAAKSYNGTQAAPAGCTGCVLFPPALTWSYIDPVNKPQAAYNVTLYNDLGVVIYNSDWVTSASKSRTIPSGKLVAGTTYHWTVQVKNTLGTLSPNSDFAYFRTEGGTVVSNASVTLMTCNGTLTTPIVTIPDDTDVTIGWKYNCNTAVNVASTTLIIYDPSDTVVWTKDVVASMIPGDSAVEPAAVSFFTEDVVYHLTAEVTDVNGKKTISTPGYFTVEPAVVVEPTITLLSPLGTLSSPLSVANPVDHVVHFTYRYND